MNKTLFSILAVTLLGSGACTNQTTRKMAKVIDAPAPAPDQEFGEVRLALSQEINGDTYAITGDAGFWILEGGNRFGDEPWWTVRLRLNDGESVIVQDLYAEVPLEIAMSNLRCYVNGERERDCEFLRTVPTPLILDENERTLAELHVRFGSGITVVYSGETELGLVVETGSDADNCPSDTRAYVSLFGDEPQCVNQCGVSCDGCETVYGCASGEACIVPVDGLGLPGPPGICAIDM